MLKYIFAALLFLIQPTFAADLGAIGDSVAASIRSTGTTPWIAGQGYVAITAQRAGLVEVNVAVSGATTNAMASQWTTLLARNPKPSCILYAPGENDIPNTSVETYQAQVHSQLANAIANGISASNITILTPFIYQNSTYYAAAPAYLTALRAEAASFGIPVIDIFRLFAEYSLTRSDYSTLINSDGHPTPAGMIKIADQFQLPENASSCAYKNPPLLPPSNRIPAMTANPTDGVSMDGNNLGGAQGNSNGEGIYVISANPPHNIQWNQGGTGWVSADFGSTSFVAKTYAMTARSEVNAQAYAPKSWTFYGSNDGANWTTLDTRSNVAAWSVGERRQFMFTNSIAYSKYKMQVTASQSGTYLQWKKFEITE